MEFMESLWSSSDEWGHWTKVAAATAAAVAAVWLLQRHRAARRLSRLRTLWDSRPRDVVTLHMFDRALNCPNPSPYPIKLETYLRMVGIKYVPDFEEPMSSKSKSPWITVNGVDVADSQLAIEYLTRELGKDVESHLNPEEKTLSRSLRIMIEEHFYWCLALERWVYLEGRENIKFFPPFFPAWFPDWLVNRMFKWMGRNLILKQACGAGIGRHSRPEVEEMGKGDLSALSAYLGDKKDFLLASGSSSAPCLADVSLFGFVCMLTCLPEDTGSIYRRHLEEAAPNILRHRRRFIDRYWPDWETARYGKEEQEDSVFVDH